MNATTRSGTPPTPTIRSTNREPGGTGPEPSTRNPWNPPFLPGTRPRNWPTCSRRPAARSTPHGPASTRGVRAHRPAPARGDLRHRAPRPAAPWATCRRSRPNSRPCAGPPRPPQAPRPRPDALRVASYTIAALAAVTVSMVSVFSGVVTYEPLLLVTTAHSSGDSSSWWPILVYGPWLAGSLSILRAALHQRRALHSWFVVLLFSSVAVLLCVAQAPAPSPTRRPRPFPESPPWPASSNSSARSPSPARPAARSAPVTGSAPTAAGRSRNDPPHDDGAAAPVEEAAAPFRVAPVSPGRAQCA